MNRLSESLKLIEDFIRFSLENKSLLTQIRALRHSFLRVKRSPRAAVFIEHRQSKIDLGRGARFDSVKRSNSMQVITSNLARAKESARILEEVFKVCGPAESRIIKAIRFQIYDIEQNIQQHIARQFNLQLYAIIDDTYVKKSKLNKVTRQLVRHGATMIQLRAKGLSDPQFLDYARTIRRNLEGTSVVFIINDRVDIALACRAHGVHLGRDDVPVKTAREIIGDFRIIGASARTLKQAVKAEKAGADYLGVGAVFKTPTKPDAQVCGLGTLRRISRRVSIPVVGIGGITDENYKRVLAAGAAGIAVSSFLFKDSVTKRVRSLTGVTL